MADFIQRFQADRTPGVSAYVTLFYLNGSKNPTAYKQPATPEGDNEGYAAMYSQSQPPPPPINPGDSCVAKVFSLNSVGQSPMIHSNPESVDAPNVAPVLPSGPVAVTLEYAP
jgi:hypothetical protein